MAAMALGAISESSSQSIVVKTFPFTQPFAYFPVYREVHSGPSDMFFLENGTCLISGNLGGDYFVFDRNWSSLGQLTKDGFGKWGYPFHYQSLRYFVLGDVVGDADIRVYDKKDFQLPLSKIPTPRYRITAGHYDFQDQHDVFLTGNFLFGFDTGNNPIAWELGSKATVKSKSLNWATDQLGIGSYHWSDGPYFGPVGHLGYLLDSPLMMGVDVSKGKVYGVESLLGPANPDNNIGYLGQDRKGLVYAFTFLPWHSRMTQGSLAQASRENGAFCFIIIDLWKKTAVFRPLEKGEHFPTEGTDLAHSVSPDGTIYYFNLDVPNKQYVLKKVVNTWWDELGLTHTVSATVNDNRVRIRDKPSTQGQILDYLYENEVTRITNQTPQPDEVSGVKAPWYKITMPDGRQGWVFGQFLNLETP
jgi:hypothetical protein